MTTLPIRQMWEKIKSGLLLCCMHEETFQGSLYALVSESTIIMNTWINIRENFNKFITLSK